MKLLLTCLTTLALSGLSFAAEEELVKRAKKGKKPAPAPPSHGGKAKVYQNCVVPGTFALTFDDGPYMYEQTLVDFLNKNGVKATFFVNGNNWDCIYDDGIWQKLQHAYKSGHTIASHTWSHADITTLSLGQLKSEMDRVSTALQKILGITPNLFRAPYGSIDDKSLANLNTLGYSNVILWSFDSGDSVGASAAQSQSDYKKYIAGLSKSSSAIALNHEPYATTVNKVVPYAVNLIKQKGLKMVSIDECTGIAAYKKETGVLGKPDSTWHC